MEFLGQGPIKLFEWDGFEGHFNINSFNNFDTFKLLDYIDFRYTHEIEDDIKTKFVIQLIIEKFLFL